MRPSESPHGQGWWLSRALRGARPDRNPLRRAIDRLQTCLLAGLLVALAVGAPFAAQAASHASYAEALHARQEQLASRHEVRAVLSSDAALLKGYSLNTRVLTAATWASVAGVHRSGEVPAPPGSPSGTTVTIWTDDESGYLDNPPLTMAEAAGQADAAIAGVITAAGLAYVVGAWGITALVNRRRMAAWEADWLATARTWNRQRW
ncbi:MAG: Rv1733c family protein [Trebonia sp.]